MAVAQRLPNGHIVLLLSPREAVNLSDELLEPDEYPWQSTESQMTSMEVRKVLMGLAEENGVGEMNDVVKEPNRRMEGINAHT